MGNGEGTATPAPRFFPPAGSGCPRANLLLVVGVFGLGALLVYGVAYFGLPGRSFFKVLGGLALVFSLWAAALDLKRYFGDKPVTHWGSGVGLLLTALRLYLGLYAEDAAACHLTTAKWGVLLLTLLGALLSLSGLFLLLEKRAGGGTSGAASPPETDQVKNLAWLLMAFLVHLFESNDLWTSKPTPDEQVVDRDELKNLILVLVEFLALFVLANQFVLDCWW